MTINPKDLKAKLNTNLHYKLQSEQGRAAQIYPQLAPLIYNLKFVADENVDTMGVNESCEVYYSPKWVTEAFDFSKHGRDSVVQAILHETLHVFLDFWGRKYERDHLRWNVAHDLEIYQYARPHECVKPADFKLEEGKAAEYYYANLPEGVKTPCCQHLVLSNSKDARGTMRAIIQAAEEIIKHHEAGRGDTHGLLRKALEIAAPARGDHRLRAIQGSMLTNGLMDSSYERPNRRLGTIGGVVHPAPVFREPRCGVVLDVSGSMGNMLKPAVACLMSAVKSIGTSLDVVAWDTQPVALYNVRSQRDIDNLKFSGGGTDMAAGIRYMNTRSTYDAIMVITDCDTPWPTEAELKNMSPVYVLSVKGGPPTYMNDIPMRGVGE